MALPVDPSTGASAPFNAPYLLQQGLAATGGTLVPYNNEYINWLNSGAGTGQTNTPTTPAFDPTPYDQLLGNYQTSLNRLGTQRATGNTNIENSYNTALQQLLGQKNIGQRNYNEGKQQSALDFVGAKNSARVNAGNALNGLQRLLGSRGAGGGSAYNTAAPQAVAGWGTEQLGGVGNTYGQNQRSLDTNWNDFMDSWKNQELGIGGQRDTQKFKLNQELDTTQAELLSKQAALQAERDQAQGGNGIAAAQPYLNQANSILDRLAGQAAPTINYQTQAYQAPSLASYVTNPAQAAQARGPAGSDYFSPYLSTLLGKKQQGVY